MAEVLRSPTYYAVVYRQVWSEVDGFMDV